MHELSRLGLLIGFAMMVLSTLPVSAQNAGVNGFVCGAVNKLPVNGATVTLDLKDPTADGQPEFTVTPGEFGFFRIADVPPDTYELRISHPAHVDHVEEAVLTADKVERGKFELVPLTGETYFDLYVQIQDVQSTVPLQGADVTIFRWQEDPAVSGAAFDESRVVMTDANGTVVSSGWQEGFFSFQVNKTAWQSLVFPNVNPTFLDTSQMFTAKLAPVPQIITVNVTGLDPTKTDANDVVQSGPLKGVTVELIGLDPRDGSRVLPAQQFTTLANGVATFSNLSSINYTVTVKRLGYAEFGETLLATPDGSYEPLDVLLQLKNTSVEIKLTSPYKDPAVLSTAVIRLTGYNDSSSQDVKRERPPTISTDHGVAKFDHLFPGRYMVEVIHRKKTMGPYPTSSQVMILNNLDAQNFDVRFYAQKGVVEAVSAETTPKDFAMEPIPAVITGRLFIHDELVDPVALISDPTIRYSDGDRLIKPKQHAGIQFAEHKKVDLLPDELLEDGFKVFSTDSDTDGTFCIQVMPGLFGIRIPTLNNYSGHNIEYRNITAGEPQRKSPWPYAKEWPYADIDFGHNRSALGFSSATEYGVDLFCHGHWVHLSGEVLPATADPLKKIVMAAPNDNPILVDYNDILAFNGTAELTGDATMSTPIIQGNFYMEFIFLNLQPGTYAITGDHERNTFNTVNVTIAPWKNPGILPEVSPTDPENFFPGIQHELHREPNFEPLLEAAYNTTPGLIDIAPHQTRDIGVEEVKFACTKLSAAPFDYIRPSFTGGSIFAYEGLPPTDEYTAWRLFTNEWFQATGTGEDRYDAFLSPLAGDPQKCTPNTSTAPPWSDTYILLTEALSRADPTIVIPGIQLNFLDGGTAIGNTESETFGGGFALKAAGAVDIIHVPPKWTYAGGHSEVIDVVQRKVKVTVFMDRTMTIEGIVKSEGVAVPFADVIVRRRNGSIVVGSTQANASGFYSLSAISPQTVFIDVEARGFFPFRERLEPPSPDQDITFDPVLVKLPPPTISNIELTRYGLFLPGISKTGNSDARLVGADDQLLMRWKADVAIEDNIQYTLTSYQDKNGVSENQTFDIEDRVSEVILIDPRFFDQPAYNTPTGDADQANVLQFPEPFNYATFQPILQEIQNQEKANGDKFIITFDRTRKTEEGLPNRYMGTLNLYDLPSGKFIPEIVVITARGAVARMTYTKPEGKKTLTGLRLPPWLAFLADFFGSELDGVEVAGKTTDALAKLVPEGKFIPLPGYSIDISETDGYVKYKYNVSISKLEGTKTPESGPLSSGSSSFGISFKGTLGVTVDGEGFITLKDEVALNKSIAKELGLYKPANSKRARVNIKTLKATGTAKLEVSQNFFEPAPSTDLNNQALMDKKNAVPEFRVTGTGRGFLESRIHINLTPILSKIPPPAVGAILLGADKSGALQFNGVIDLGAGAQYVISWETSFPSSDPPQGTNSIEQDTRRHFLGGTREDRVEDEFALLFKYGIGLNVRALGGLTEGTGTIQLGAPRGSSLPGVKVTLNENATGSPYVRVEGAVSGVLALSLNLYLVSYNKNYQWDGYDIDQQIGPGAGRAGFAAIAELTPLNVIYSVVNPAAVPAADFLGGSNKTIIDNLFRNARMHVTGGATPAMIFTDTDPASDGMRLQFSLNNQSGWQAPITLASGTGIIDAAAIANPQGGWVAVWTEVAAADIGSPYPSSSVMFATSNNEGTVWSAPAVIPGLALDETAIMPKLVAAGGKLLLALLSTEEGPLGTLYKPRTAVFDPVARVTWTLLDELPRQKVLGLSLSAQASTADAILVVVDDSGKLDVRQWTGGSGWSAPETLTTHAGEAVASAYDAAGLPVISWEDPGDPQEPEESAGISMFRRDASGSWNAAPDVRIVADGVTIVSVTPLGDAGDPRHLLVWGEGGDKTFLFSAHLAGTGSVLQDRTLIHQLAAGQHRSIDVRPLAGNDAIVTSMMATTGGATVEEFTLQFGQIFPPPPTITENPTDGSFSRGADTNLSVTVANPENVTYQWYHNFVAISGAIGSTLALVDLQPEDSGAYHVIVDNGSDSEVSDLVRLTVSDDVSIELLPQWNLVSFPVDTPMTVGEIFRDENDVPLTSGLLWIWDVHKGRFRGVGPNEILKAFTGAWVFSIQGGKTRPFSANAVGEPTPEGHGWHLMGLAAAGPTPAAFRPAAGMIWGWRENEQRFESIDASDPQAFRLLKAYWILHFTP